MSDNIFINKSLTMNKYSEEGGNLEIDSTKSPIDNRLTDTMEISTLEVPPGCMEITSFVTSILDAGLTTTGKKAGDVQKSPILSESVISQIVLACKRRQKLLNSKKEDEQKYVRYLYEEPDENKVLIFFPYEVYEDLLDYAIKSRGKDFVETYDVFTKLGIESFLPKDALDGALENIKTLIDVQKLFQNQNIEP